MFAALAGSKTDGARFVADAVARGAAAILARPELADEAKALGVAFIADENPRLGLARMAAEFYGAQPDIVAAVTGTKGKSSIVAFLREIWTVLGTPAASLGTVGVISPGGEIPLSHTTPDPVEIHALLARLKKDGVEHLAIEASSHGLDQFRLDGVKIQAAGFTNLTRDHMDYHSTFAHYLAAKLRLIDEVVAPDGVAVINADGEHADAFIAAAKRRELRLITVGELGDTIKLIGRESSDDTQDLTVTFAGVPLQNSVAAGGRLPGFQCPGRRRFGHRPGRRCAKVFAALAHLKGAPGRMEKVAFAAAGAPVYVDYAHTPDSLEKILQALRPHTKNNLHVVFGCGGDRDKGKRPLMGQIATALADAVIVTDDNPRSEDAAVIRKEILAAAKGAREIGDRHAAIQAAIASLKSGDVLVIAGKGHETGQYVGATVIPFSDRDEAIKAAVAGGGRPA